VYDTEVTCPIIPAVSNRFAVLNLQLQGQVKAILDDNKATLDNNARREESGHQYACADAGALSMCCISMF
jgi:hypothetical protein